jgi:aspartyl-tRNA(Asn)/glutamyl-tRNA(Gln) amidotransferase subunit B
MKGAIRRTILAGMMLGCSTPPVVKWDRKNYFYPDMPKNYQLTQFDLPPPASAAASRFNDMA